MQYTKPYMKVTIYVPAMKLKRIKQYCEEKGIPMSTVFTRGAMSIANSQPIPKCDYCKNPSMGKYEVTVQDWSQGEINQEHRLCAYHLKKAQDEGEVTEL